MTYLEKAIKDGYANITGTNEKQKITYITSNGAAKNYNDSEEKIRAEFWAELIYKYEYPVNRIKVEVAVPDRLPANHADIVVFSDDACTRPYAVVECEKDGITDAEFNQAIEQGVGNATWIKLRAEYAVIIAGETRRVLDVSDKFGILEREKNVVADLPKAYGKPQEYRFYKGTTNDIKPVSRETLIAAIKKCHQTLWGGGRLSPPTAFGELCKLIFVKISDEQKHRRDGEPYQFQIKTHEPSATLATRINVLYDEQKTKDPEVFTDSIKVDDRVLRAVVSHLEAINLSKTDLDVKGVAFEQFMDGFFKGDFGQYFTPRPIIEFCVKMMKPQQDWDILDPSCGSGGFLLHALDYMRSQAGEYYEKGTVEYYNYWHDFAAKHLYGIEINDEIARVAKMNMIVHDDGHTNVISHDALESIDKIHDRNKGFSENRFDLILTNPPFGSRINLAEKPYLAIYGFGCQISANGKVKVRKNQSSEVLFIERIWQFLKPGTGKAAIVLPDGILTNSSLQYVRDFILAKFQLLAVVSLPQCTFSHFGAGVKSSVVFVRKRKENEMPDDGEVTFMAAPELIGYDATGRKTESQLDDIVEKWEKFQENVAAYQTTYDLNNPYVFTVKRCDFEERIDVPFYHPSSLQVLSQIDKSKYNVLPLCELLESLTDGTHYTPTYTDSGIKFVSVTNVTENEIDFKNTKYISKNEHNELNRRCNPKQGDILLTKIGSIGRAAVVPEDCPDFSIFVSVALLKLKDKINPEYLCAYLNSSLSKKQFERHLKGIGVPDLHLENIEKTQVILPQLSQQIELANKYTNAYRSYKQKLEEAEREWQAAKEQFEKELLGE